MMLNTKKRKHQKSIGRVLPKRILKKRFKRIRTFWISQRTRTKNLELIQNQKHTIKIFVHGRIT